MKKLKNGLLITLLLQSMFASAQRTEIIPSDYNTYHSLMMEKCKDLIEQDSTEFSKGIFYDVAYPLSRLNYFNTDSFNTSNFNHFLQVWSELNQSKIYGDKQPLTTDRVRNIAMGYEQNDTIAIGIINVDYTALSPFVLDSLALQQDTNALFVDSLGYYNRRDGYDPYIDLQKTIVTPLNSSQINGNKLNVKLSPLIFYESDKIMSSLSVTLNNKTHNLIVDSELAKNSASFEFETEGAKKLKFIVGFSDGISIETFADINVNFISPEDQIILDQLSVISTPPTSFEGGFIKAEYLTFLAEGNTELTKPIIITDGFDPGDVRGILTSKIEGQKSFMELTEYDESGNPNPRRLIEKLNSEGYDVIVLNFIVYKTGTETINLSSSLPDWIVSLYGVPNTITFDVYVDGGADYIERNAQILKVLIRQTNETLLSNNSEEKIVLMGPSMGGLISRVALTEMEQENENHNTRLYVSFDSPHKGANISIGVQKSIEFSNSEDGLYSLNSPAAKQMLLNHYSEHNNWQSPQEHYLRTSFKSKLDNCGFPQQTDRNIALINGVLNGTQIGTPGGNIVNFDENITVWFTFIPLPYHIWLRIKRDKGGENTKVFSVKTPNNHSVNKYAFAHNDKGSLDCSPGGAYDILPILQSSWNNNLNSDTPWYVFGIGNGCVGEDESTTVDENFCFIPSKSALAYSGPNKLWAEDLNCENLVCKAYTPFDNYYAPNENQFHVAVTEDGVDWLLAELNENPIYNYNESCTYDLLEIDNDVVHCTDTEDTYIVWGTCNPTNWESSVGVNITSVTNYNDQSFVHVTKTIDAFSIGGTRTNKWIKATFPDGTVLKKYLMDKPLYKFDHNTNNYFEETDYTIDINPEVFDFDAQSVNSYTDIQWEIISMSHNANWLISANNLHANFYGAGTSSEFFVNGKVKITNGCGTTTKTFFASYPKIIYEPGDVKQLLIFKIGEDEYQVVDPDSPEMNIISTSNLYNLFGTQIDSYLHSGDAVQLDEYGVPAFRVLKVTMNGKEKSKTIFID